MALVAYSDSEGSDAEPETTPVPSIDQKKSDSKKFQADHTTGKIRVALPEIKPEPSPQDAGDGSRKKPRIGGGLSGFNSFLPAPKRAAEKKAPVATARKAFGLKTGAGPGFDRGADAEMKNDFAFDSLAGKTEEKPEASTTLNTPADAPATMKKQEDVKLQGNPMMFRPLSVGRPQKKRKINKMAEQPTPGPAAPKAEPLPQHVKQAPAPTTKPKVSLFSLSSEDSARPEVASAPSTTYQPLVYNAQGEGEGEALVDPALAESAYVAPTPATATVSSKPGSSLDSIANDLNLSKSERRQLFGRNAMSSQSHVRTFNTDEEYASNQVLAQGELAAAAHNPVRSIAPGKHTLQQLVNAASSQKEALEESFASGRRNKKEAGSKYGW
ncbi:unnamed protein product [Penicillium salamii]|uniref:Mitotic checkpoint regulator, MAD2B-interacting-domain-containing protein n=1 Tax=Penicillium salamii TaxID=1612424 RepID=A0A9W4K175_9EURO|nr:unnamed protein product [Penicillium salamii]CAG8099573.1 unnamed protein product [Penicillium salamii]CAG8295249.1 unnamed protein product [Penicillium salamii]CAG8324439.1 unnamed protein product [Penicillium salamii]CAG8417656.1 unnamed protein product [Penicillium salamii]